MRILVAPDSFKESLTAAEAADAIARGLRSARPELEVDLCPMADGGEGTVDALVKATGGSFQTTTVTGPLGQAVDARWGRLGDGRTAVIEMAQAAGLHLVPHGRRDPMRTTTYGVGELIRAALDEGVSRIVLGIGGSATCDSGMGMAQALGVTFTPAQGRASPLAGGALLSITHVDTATRDPRLDQVTIRAACDVTNPLTGPNGAAHVYGPQKGASPEMAGELDAGLAHLASLLGVDPELPGAGAAGGLGYGLVAFCGAMLERGVELVMDAVDFDPRIAHADLVITGEGRLDAQSIHGKTCIGVARRAARHNKPCIALVGSASDDADLCLAHGLAAYHTLVNDQLTTDQAIAHAATHLQRRARDLAADLDTLC